MARLSPACSFHFSLTRSGIWRYWPFWRVNLPKNLADCEMEPTSADSFKDTGLLLQETETTPLHAGHLR